MQRKKIIFLGILLLGCSPFGLYAQETTLGGGGDATGNGSFSYSIGQVFYMTSYGTDGTASQGVQQPYEISSTVGVTEYDAITLDFEIYPNPTTDYLTLNVNDFPLDELDYVLYDVSGRVLDVRKINQNNTIIEMMNFPESTYFLKVSNGTTTMKTFKIIKN
ncbi:MAG: T9SS type A sorting domain-containing protein [Crocinitomicaceae bacterium]|nr:T9SS type A sorting domain-containing protein [Flavobacteriales bacterium]NQZ35011.1 T9SS type A sorting domain-containing protein [Crocinitomicaceae bacterium]